MSTIPASDIVTVNPSVISAGGTALSLNGLILTQSTRVPVGTVLSFPNQLAVSNWFGANSQEASNASVYFAGFDGSNVKPGSILFYQYSASAVSAYLKGASLAGTSLSTLQSFSGVLSVTINGSLQTSSAINLSTVTSFTNAAQVINQALGLAGPQAASVTGSITGTTFTVTAVSSGNLAIGQTLSGTGVTAGTYITAMGTGTGGVGDYTVSVSQTATSTTITATAPVVTYDSTWSSFVITSPSTGASSTITYASGTIASSLGLTQTNGAVLSQGDDAATPAGAMNNVIQQTQNWASFTTNYEPTTDDGVAFALWEAQQNNRYLFAAWDTDASVASGVAGPNTLGGQVVAAVDSGTALIYEPSDLGHAYFLLGAIASIDFTQKNGRATMAFRGQSGLSAGVTDAASAAQLILNGYNYYGAYATATSQFTFMYPGTVVGPFQWIDSYVNQIWLNSSLQQALISLLTQVKSIPYNDAGYTLIRQSCMDPINAAINFGAIRENIPLSAVQAAEVNAQAGVQIDQTLGTVGWYLQILPASAQVRAQRTSPPITLWYMDGGSVQKISLGSILVQ